MVMSQNDSGRALEFGLAEVLSEKLHAHLIENEQDTKAKGCFERCSANEQKNIRWSTEKAADFLIAHDRRLESDNCVIKLQPDQRGEAGDVRDIIIINRRVNEEIGISAKNRHTALKHSRLSRTIDFGREWLGASCSTDYFQVITPLFDELEEMKELGRCWRDISDKAGRYYAPVLIAFKAEVQRLFAENPEDVAKSLVKYLLGRYDYYKVVKENGTTSIKSFNIDGTLKWGSRIALPSRIIELSMKPRSRTTLLMVCDHGWQISFRIHNASKIVEPSLKFDIQLVGQPHNLESHLIDYR